MLTAVTFLVKLNGLKLILQPPNARIIANVSPEKDEQPWQNSSF